MFFRYLAVTHAVSYNQKLKHTTWYPVLMIVLCWTISIGIALPIVLGANYSEHRTDQSCSFFNPMFSMLSSMGSFFIPTFVMVILYYKIFKVIRSRAQLTKAVKPCPKPAVPVKKEASSIDSGQSEKSSKTDKSDEAKQSTLDISTKTEFATIDHSEGGGTLNGWPKSEDEDGWSLEKFKTGDLQSKANGDAEQSEKGHLLSGGLTDRSDVQYKKRPSVPPIKLRKSSSKKMSKREKRERRATVTLVVVLCK